MRTLLAAAGLALSVGLHAVAQAPAPSAPPAPAPQDPSAPPPDAPMDTFLPPSVTMPSEGWTAEQKSDAAVKQARQMLATMQKAYAAAPGISETVVLTVKLPQGDQKDTLEVAMGQGNDLRMAMRGMQILVAKDTIYMVPDQPADKYLETAVQGGDVEQTLQTLVPGFAIPVPTYTLRHAKDGADVSGSFGMGAVQNVKLAGFRQAADGTSQVLMTGSNGEVLVVADPKSQLLKSMNVVFTPDGLPDAIKFSVVADLSAQVGPLAKPIAFEAGPRAKVGTLADLFPMPDDGNGGGKAAQAPRPKEPEIKVKVGQDAPVATLPTLDGKSVNLADLKGKVVVLDFWATWCGPCMRGLPLLDQFAASMKDNPKVAVYAVNTWEIMGNSSPSEADLEKAHKKVEAAWAKLKPSTLTTLIDAKAAFVETYGFEAIPAMVIIGPDGKLLETHVGFDPELVKHLTAKVNAALGTGSAAPAAPPAGK